jgi:hypothetical protein
MYSFQPLADTTWNIHYGFYFVLVVSLVIFGMMLYARMNDEIELQTLGIWTVIFGIIVYLTSVASYRDQVVYKNTRVVGEFVSFQPEMVVERSGKSTTTKHLMYVTYRVGNEMVVMPADPEVSYPKSVVLYKN